MGEQIQHDSFLLLVLDGGVLSALYPSHCTLRDNAPNNDQIGDCVGSTVSMDTLKETKTSCPH
jgi:hypothetical protein